MGSYNWLLRLLMLLILFVSVIQITIMNAYVFTHTNEGNLVEAQIRRPVTQQHNIQTQDRISDAIVYLAQFKDHSTYGVQYDAQHNAITGISKLNNSLTLLYSNYVNQFPSCHVIIFHDATDVPSEEVKTALSQNRPQLRFRQLDGKWWELPYGLKQSDRWKWARNAFSVGYRHMMRWFAILIWPYLAQEGYTHVMVSVFYARYNIIACLQNVFFES